MLVYLYCLVELSKAASARQAFYGGLAVGGLTAALQLNFFWNIFGPAALALWIILAFWIGLFVALARLCQQQFSKVVCCLVIPAVWLGLEYFRSELYYLRFSWANVGFAFHGAAGRLPFGQFGMYGVGFLLVLIVCALRLIPTKKRVYAGVGLAGALALLLNFPAAPAGASEKVSGTPRVAGIQLEFPSEGEVLSGLNKLTQTFPEAELLVLSEYTLDGPVPERVKTWCRRHQKYLVIGGKDPVGASEFRNTAFVVGPDGEIVFRQGKSVPIQFFKDGLAATEQKLWKSPWGEIGICICYDLSYARVTDRLVREGARALIVPTMDVADWGRQQHELHARVAPVRAEEYGIPIFRLASSGISQCVDAHGNVVASAPFAGEAAMLSGALDLSRTGRLPLDRRLAPVTVGMTLVLVVWFIFKNANQSKREMTRIGANGKGEPSSGCDKTSEGTTSPRPSPPSDGREGVRDFRLERWYRAAERLRWFGGKETRKRKFYR